jgi:hypothetical protein
MSDCQEILHNYSLAIRYKDHTIFLLFLLEFSTLWFLGYEKLCWVELFILFIIWEMDLSSYVLCFWIIGLPSCIFSLCIRMLNFYKFPSQVRSIQQDESLLVKFVSCIHSLYFSNLFPITVVMFWSTRFLLNLLHHWISCLNLYLLCPRFGIKSWNYLCF